MKKIGILNLKNGRNYQACFETSSELNSWKLKHVAKDTWGKAERWILDNPVDTISVEEKNSALDSREVTVQQEIEIHTYQMEDNPDYNSNSLLSAQQIRSKDENGEDIILSTEIIPEVKATEYLLPAEYTITVVDSINGYFNLEIAYQDLRDLRDKYLAETDFTQLPDAPISSELRQLYKAYRQYLRNLPNSYDDSSIAGFQVQTFEEYQISEGSVV